MAHEQLTGLLERRDRLLSRHRLSSQEIVTLSCVVERYPTFTMAIRVATFHSKSVNLPSPPKR